MVSLIILEEASDQPNRGLHIFSHYQGHETLSHPDLGSRTPGLSRTEEAQELGGPRGRLSTLEDGSGLECVSWET